MTLKLTSLLVLLGAATASAQTVTTPAAPQVAVAPAALADIAISGLTPAFDPAVKKYSVARTRSCSMDVTATLAKGAEGLIVFVSNVETASGAPRRAWVCDADSRIDVVVSRDGTEVARYVIDVAGAVPGPETVVPFATPVLSNPVAEPAAPKAAPANPSISLPGIPVPAPPRDTAIVVPSAPPATALPGAPVASSTPAGTMGAAVSMMPPPAADAGLIAEMMGTGEPRESSAVTAYEPVPERSPVARATLDSSPSKSAITTVSAARFLNQATFGASAAEIANVQNTGVKYWLAQQFQAPESSIPENLDITMLRNLAFLNMANGQDQLRQRMMFALSQILVVSANKLTTGVEMTPWQQMLSRYAFSNYRTLLREVTISPSMGRFLDLANSLSARGRTAPNENYPREVMQLFSIGVWQLNQNGTLKTDSQGFPIPTYDQQTVREVARALTGWTYPTPPGTEARSQNSPFFVGVMEPRPQNHDTGAKSILGKTIPANQTVTKDMEDVMDILFNHPNVPPFVATRLIRSLVTSNPSGAYIKRVADVFVDDGTGVRGNLMAVLKAIFMDSEASLSQPLDGHLKDAILNVISLGRALGAEMGDTANYMYLLTRLGQQPLTPTSVFSFYSPLSPMRGEPTLFGPEFQLYSPAIALQRANLVYGLLNNSYGIGFRLDLTPYNAVASNPAALVELVNQKLLFGTMSAELRAIVLAATQATTSNSERVRGALYLTALSSEFLVYAK
jgi:uncharacterized protein (DUF1800 family)